MKATKDDLKKIGRLKKRSDFLCVGDKGGKWVSKSLIMLAMPNGMEISRFGVTVTKRLEKSAVARNRMKRRLRAAAADVITHGSKAGVDYVLIARQETAVRDYADIVKDLRWCLTKMGHGA